MINDDDLVGLAEDCINICEVLKIGVEGKDVGDLSNLVNKAIGDLEGCPCYPPRLSIDQNNGELLVLRTALNGQSRHTSRDLQPLGYFMPSLIRRRSNCGGRRSIRSWACSTYIAVATICCFRCHSRHLGFLGLRFKHQTYEDRAAIVRSENQF